MFGSVLRQIFFQSIYQQLRNPSKTKRRTVTRRPRGLHEDVLQQLRNLQVVLSALESQPDEIEERWLILQKVNAWAKHHGFSDLKCELYDRCQMQSLADALRRAAALGADAGRHLSRKQKKAIQQKYDGCMRFSTKDWKTQPKNQ